MPYLPNLPTWEKNVINTQEFLGLNRGLNIGDGELADMVNMSSDKYPVLSTRAPRGVPNYAREGTMQTEYSGSIDGMLGTDHLTICHNGKVYLDGREIPITLSTDGGMREKKLVGMGAHVCIWPDKKYFHVNNLDDYGDMGHKWTATSGASLTAMMCRKDGTNYDDTDIVVSDTAPSNPENNDFWIDSSGDTHILKQYSSTYQQWVQVATTYVKIQGTGIGKGFKTSDVVFLSNLRPNDEAATQQTLTFSRGNAKMLSSYTVTKSNGKWSASTPSTHTCTMNVEVTGIPAGAVIKSASWSFVAGGVQEGVTGANNSAEILTVNGATITESGSKGVSANVKGNGVVSISFKFKTKPNLNTLQNATSGKQYTDTITMSNIVLRVTYATKPSNPDLTDNDIKELERMNTSNILYGCGDDYLIVAGMLDRVVELSDALEAELKIPDLDYVCEAGNRIWGCVRSEADGNVVNEVRACSLGDFRNWYRFEGTAMDSYTASVGSEGNFTAAYSFQGQPIFMKEAYIHKISGTIPANFTLNTLKARGVQEGSWKSLAVVNETLFYKSRGDVMAFEGSTPYSVSAKLGNDYFSDAVAGAYRDKYFICMQDEGLKWATYVLDVIRGVWHKEDASRVSHMAAVGGELVLACEEDDITKLQLVSNRGNAGETFPWMVTFGVLGFQSEQQKYLSRYNIRAQLTAGSYMKVEMQYDSDGKWHHIGTMKSPRLQTYLLPIIPRRCDHCQLRISGVGEAHIYSIAREYENGGDG